MLLHPLIATLAGAATGYGWHRLVGCRSGTCLITAKWWTATLYGALIGFVMSTG